MKNSKELEFYYNTKETRVGIEEGVSLEVELYAMRVLIKVGVWNKEWLFGELIFRVVHCVWAIHVILVSVCYKLN